jgi:hypothetical protein
VTLPLILLCQLACVCTIDIKRSARAPIKIIPLSSVKNNPESLIRNWEWWIPSRRIKISPMGGHNIPARFTNRFSDTFYIPKCISIFVNVGSFTSPTTLIMASATSPLHDSGHRRFVAQISGPTLMYSWCSMPLRLYPVQFESSNLRFGTRKVIIAS